MALELNSDYGSTPQPTENNVLVNMNSSLFRAIEKTERKEADCNANADKSGKE